MPFHILHVDDEPDIRDIVSMALSLDPEIEVTSVASGTEALTRLETLRPNLVLLDVLMPGMDGPNTLAAMRARPTLRQIPVVFMTARVHSGEIEKLLALGAKGVIAKPFDPMKLAQEARAFL